MMGHPHTEPLAKRRLFQSMDLDEARAIVAGKFCDHRLHIAGGDARFDACHHRAEGQNASLNYIRYGADVTIEPGELGSFYLIQIPLAGVADIDNGTGAVATHSGLGSVLNPHRHTKMRWRAGCSQMLLQIDAQALQNAAERLIGATLAEPVTFVTAVDIAHPVTAAWVKTLKTCFGLAEREAIFGQDRPGRQARIEDELITGFLRSQPSSVSARLAAAPSSISHAHLRRAVQFVQSNLQNPITMAEIADASGTSPRSLQMHFQAAFGQSPMRYLRQQRLFLARHLILDAGAEAIGDIAHRAGFAHFGRFSAAYREQFGEAPSDTKARSITTARPVQSGKRRRRA